MRQWLKLTGEKFTHKKIWKKGCEKKVIWSIRASTSLDYYCEIIAEESPSSAKKVRREIVLTAKTLSKNPELYQLDEYYPNNQ